MSDAREAVFSSIRTALRKAGAPPAAPAPPATSPGTPAGLESREARLAGFRDQLEGVDGCVHVVADEEAAAEVLRELVARYGAKDLALSDAPLVRAVTSRVDAVESFDAWTDRERLIDADMGVTSAQAGIAETGTLLLLSEDERHRVASLVPPVHVALLEASTIVRTLGDAIERARTGGELPHLVTLITGPSRTGDIELTIVVGVHGPRNLHVILFDR